MVLNNKRGQVIFYTLMLGIVVIILAMALTPVVNEFVNGAKNSTDETHVGLDCSNESISDFTKSQCVITDITTPYFFFSVVAIALLVIGARLVLT